MCLQTRQQPINSSQYSQKSKSLPRLISLPSPLKNHPRLCRIRDSLAFYMKQSSSCTEPYQHHCTVIVLHPCDRNVHLLKLDGIIFALFYTGILVNKSPFKMIKVIKHLLYVNDWSVCLSCVQLKSVIIKQTKQTLFHDKRTNANLYRFWIGVTLVIMTKGLQHLLGYYQLHNAIGHF